MNSNNSEPAIYLIGLQKRALMVCIGLSVLFLTLQVFGQEPLQKSNNTADQSLRSEGRVNPSTLGMEFELPLGSYPGRGINLPLGISYSSKQWRLEEQTTIPQANGGNKVWTFPLFSENAAAGWTSSLSEPYIEYTGEKYRFQANGMPLSLDEVIPPGTPPHSGESYIKRITVFLRGEAHELRAQDAPISLNNGEIPPASAWNAIFYAVDGSGLKYVQDSAAATPIYRLYLPDGSYYDFNTDYEYKSTTDLMKVRYAIKLTDVHGNYVQYNAPNPGAGYPNGSWSDQLGRTFPIMVPRKTPTIQAGKQSLEQSFYLPGMGQSYTLVWKRLLGESEQQEDSALTDIRTQELHYPGAVATGSSTGTYGPALFLTSTEYRCSGGNGPQVIYAATPYPGELFNPAVLTEIILPTGAKYRFSYNEFGELERIYHPTGGREEMSYGEVPALAELTGLYKKTNRGVTQQNIYDSEIDSAPDTWSFSAASSANNYRVSVAAPDGTQTDRFMHRGVPPISCAMQNASDYYGPRHGYDNALSGMIYEIRAFSSGTPKHILYRTLTKWTATTTSTLMALPSTYMQRNARVYSTQSIVYQGDAGLASAGKSEYDTDVDDFGSPQNTVRTKEYAFSVVSGGNSISAGETPPASAVTVPDPTTSATLLKTSETDYLNTSADPLLATLKTACAANNLLRLPIAVRVKDGSGTIVKQNKIAYDEADYSPGAGHGLATSNYAWDSGKGLVTDTAAYIRTRAGFSSFGNPTLATDGKGSATTITYDPVYHAFPISSTSPIPDDNGLYASGASLVKSSTFNTTTGLPLTKTDQNGQVTEINYDPDTLRLVSVRAPNGQWTEYSYGVPDSNGVIPELQRFAKTRVQIDAAHWKESYDWMDGFGRIVKNQVSESTGDVFSEKEYDTMGRVKRTTDPFKTGETKRWTTPEYDDLDRAKKITLPDSSVVLMTYGISTSGVIGITKTAADQTGRKRTGISDAQNRMIRVIEDPDSQNLATDYIFDTMGNLRKVTQASQVRYYSYDSLGQVIRAKQVEQEANSSFALPVADPVTGNNSWSVKYIYDDNGNITATSDAKNVTASATYDRLNRVVKKDFSDSTPDTTFYYDGKGLPSVPDYSNGKRTRTTNGVSDERYTSFDVMGNLLASEQIIDTRTFSFGYTYNLAGGMLEEFYPSGRVVKSTFSPDGNLQQVQSKKTSASGYWTYADAFSYTSAGQVKKMQLGNGHWETAVYNDRLQVMQIGLGRLDTTQDLLKLEFEYTSAGVQDNNGSMRQQKITVPAVGGTSGFTATQTYTYDSLNRLQSAAEVISSPTWKQTFLYDRYGNRRFDTSGGNTTTLGSCAQEICNPTFNTSTNRFASGQYYTYDANGSVTEDAGGLRFVYDAERRQTEVRDDEDTLKGQYFYDGAGKRVKKITAAETVLFVYDAQGKLAAEYSTALASVPQVSYLTSDHLGSPRVVSNENGMITGRKDFSPFGDQISSSQRTAALGYNQPDIRPDYTGYLRDEESGLEYANARYYNSRHGRFTSVDPLVASASIKNPQTLNRYSYALNSPYKFTDPLGLLPVTGVACGQFCANNQAMHLEGNGGGAVTGGNYDSGTRSGPEELAAARASAAAVNSALWQEAAGELTTDILSYNQSPGRTLKSELGDPDKTVIVAHGEPGTVENVGQNFYRAAMQAKANLESFGNTVYYFNSAISSVYGFQGLLDMAAKYDVGQILLFTHGSAENIYLGDGKPNDINTITSTSVKTLVNRAKGLFNVQIFACNVGATSNGIADQLAKQLGVRVNAPTGSMIFSSTSSKPTVTRHPDTGPTYMVHDGNSTWRGFGTYNGP